MRRPLLLVPVGLLLATVLGSATYQYYSAQTVGGRSPAVPSYVRHYPEPVQLAEDKPFPPAETARRRSCSTAGTSAASTTSSTACAGASTAGCTAAAATCRTPASARPARRPPSGSRSAPASCATTPSAGSSRWWPTARPTPGGS